MGASFSAAGVCATASAGTLLVETLLVETVLVVLFVAVLFPETEAAGPLADRLASPAPDRRVGGAALAPVAARVGLGTALPAAAPPLPGAVFAAAFVACVAPVAVSDAFVLLVVTAVILAL